MGESGAKRFMASVAADKEDVAIEIRLDEPDGRRIGLLRIAPTGNTRRNPAKSAMRPEFTI